MTANWLVPALRRVAKHRDPGHTWRDLFQQFQPFSAEGVFRSHEAGDVAARLRQAVDEAGPDRIAGDREHDRHAAGRLQQRPHGRRAMRQDDVGRERSQFCGMPADIVGSAARPVRVDAHVAADDPARLCQRLLECAEPGLIVGVVCARWQQHADAPHALALLRARCCARAASGHAAAVPPSAASNSRRPMVTVIRPSRARCVKGKIPRYDGAVFTFRGAGCWLLPP